MARRTPARAFTAGALAFSLALAACGGGDGDGDADDETTTTTDAPEDEETTTTTEASGESTTTTSGELDEDDIAAIQEAMSAWLLTQDEIGLSEFTEQPYEPSTDPNPCGANTDEEAPYTAIAGRILDMEERQVGLLQEIRLYDTVDEAASTFELGIDNLGCGTSADGSLTIGQPIDITEDVGGDTAVGIGVESDEGFGSTIIVVHYSDLVILYQFVAGPDAILDGLPDPVAVAAAGLAKIVDAIG